MNDDSKVAADLKSIPVNTRVRVHYDKFFMAWAPNGESRYVITRIEHLP